MKNTKNILWGLVLISLGIVIGGNALGLMPTSIFFNGWWTLFIIIPCFIGLFKDQDKTGCIIGLALGIVLLLASQGIIDFNLIWKLAFPAILVIIGLSMIFKNILNSKINKQIAKLNEKKNKDNQYYSIFSSQNVNFNDEVFNGATLNAVFGEIKCDLKKAILKEDAIINIINVFGDTKIDIPQNIKVKLKENTIFGEVCNETLASDKTINPTIYINTTVIFGSVKIK